MASRLSNIVCAICVLGIFGVVTSQNPDFPKIEDLEIMYYTTEAQVTDAGMQETAYIRELYDTSGQKGKMQVIVEKMIKEVYYDNSTNEILEVNATFCQKWETEDESIYTMEGVFYGFLHKDPLVIGPSALFFYAQTRRKDIKYEETEEVRNIPCDKYSLNVVNDDDNVTLYYYFAPTDWTTPYQYPQLRVPIRIHAIGESAKETQGTFKYPVDIVTDFAYFKPSIDDRTQLQPPVGLGCMLREKTNTFPEIPDTFQYTAEVIDLVYESEHTDVDAKYERVWFDEEKKIGRFDIYKKTTDSRSFQDFNTGVMFEFTKGYECKIKPLRNSFFENYDVDMIGSMKTAKEVLHFDGKFYDMGQRKIRGLTCDTYESVTRDYFYKVKLDRFVVTAYFTEDYTTVGVDGEDETRIPVAILLTGWKSPTELAFRLQHNIFAFDDTIWPAMYSNFDLDKCYTKAESKTYFVLILQATPKDAAMMEQQDELVVKELRLQISKYAVIPEWRIPFLKVDYKPIGIYASGLMVDRPPTLLQFYEFKTGESKTKDKLLKIVEAATLEDCADSCIDEGDFPCKGFYFCNAACFLKSDDPSATYKDDDKERVLGVCTEYLRAEKDSSNFHNTPLKKALENLENSVLNKSIIVEFEIPNGEETIKVADVVIGEGPYTGVDAGDRPYKVNIQYRKLDKSLMTSKAIGSVEMLNDCYKKCFEAGSECSSFSFCGRAPKQADRECIISSDLVIRGKTNDLQLIPSGECDIFDLRYIEFFTKYPEHVSFLSGYKVNDRVETVEECAKQCRMEKNGKCRGFEYCKSMKTCSLHTKHILDLKPGDAGSKKTPCVHYAARFIADYVDLGYVLVDDNKNVRYEISLEGCARVCSEELGDSCKSFNYCPGNSGGSCALSGLTITSGDITTTEDTKCTHYEKREGVRDWGVTKPAKPTGYTTKGFTGLVIGMLALGLIIGALGFVGYSYWRSRRYGEGMSVRFMKQET